MRVTASPRPGSRRTKTPRSGVSTRTPCDVPMKTAVSPFVCIEPLNSPRPGSTATPGRTSNA